MKGLLIALVLVAAVLSIPPVRERSQPLLEPGKRIIQRVLVPQIARVRDPVYRWSVMNEARALALELARRERTGQPLPRPQDFQNYVATRSIAGGVPVDKWGSPYYMLLPADSIIVVSPGPDGRPGSPDDIRYGVPRERPR